MSISMSVKFVRVDIDVDEHSRPKQFPCRLLTNICSRERRQPESLEEGRISIMG
jgi:hypothetical protein